MAKVRVARRQFRRPRASAVLRHASGAARVMLHDGKIRSGGL